MISVTVKPYKGADYNLPQNVDKCVETMIAIKNDDIKTVKKYEEDINDKLEWYSDIKTGNCFVPEQSLLSIAASYGRYNIAKYLIQKGAIIDDQDEYGSTPLHFAAMKGHLNIVKLLIENGADVNKQAQKKYIRLYGIDTNKTTGTFETPLHKACHLGHLDIVKYLIGQGARLDMVDYFGKVAIQWSMKSDDFIQTGKQKEVENYLKSISAT